MKRLVKNKVILATLAWLVVCCMLVVVNGNHGGAAAGAVKTTISAIRKGDVKALIKCMPPDEYSGISSAWLSKMSMEDLGYSKEMTQELKKADISVVDVEDDPDNSAIKRVKLLILTKDKEGQENARIETWTTRLVKGKWYVTM